MVVIDPNVVFASLDNFGGFGRGIEGLPPGRMFTPTEPGLSTSCLRLFRLHTRSLGSHHGDSMRACRLGD